jgi:PAS domain S-box-containing protein
VNFDFVAQEIMQRFPYLFGVQILRQGEIQYVYQYNRHKSVIGYNVLEDPETSVEAQEAIDKRQIFYAGPLEFQQGGHGIIGRLPIFFENKFWGFSAVLIEMDDFIQAIGLAEPRISNVSFQLSKMNPNTGEEEIFIPNAVISKLFLNYIFEESGWKITAYYQQDSVVFIILSLIICLALASSAAAGLYTHQILKKPEKLESILSEKTKEIEENNQYLTSMVQAIPDLIFIYDKEGQYLDFHAYQQSLLYYKPEEFIGKSIFELFEKEFAQKIQEVIQETLRTKKVTKNSYSLDFKDGVKYFDASYMAINEEKVLTVVREVTESKLFADKLEKSEQKYRSLVAQASDAIFLTDDYGNLLELNEKGHEMTNIPLENESGFNLNDFITLQNSNSMSLIDAVHQEGNTLQEAILLSTTNNNIPVEISCNITSEKQIQGIIRDISARKNYIQSVQHQNDKLREIAWIQSHEVRAPLARLLGLLNFLENYHSSTQEDKIKIIDSIKSSALELDVIIRDVVRRTELAENNTP